MLLIGDSVVDFGMVAFCVAKSEFGCAGDVESIRRDCNLSWFETLSELALVVFKSVQFPILPFLYVAGS